MKESRFELSQKEGVIYVVRDEQNKYLLAKRVKEKSNFHGQFLFPGGLVEDTDIDLKSALIREVKEERGADVIKSKYLGSIEYPHPQGMSIRQHVFIIEPNDFIGEMDNLEPEKEELLRVPESELPNYCTNESGKRVLQLLIENDYVKGESLGG